MITTKGRYALRVMVDLAINSNENYISLKSISQRQKISNKYLEQIIAKLNKAGFLETARGNMGGYKLARTPKEYKVGEILRATEGNLAPVNCVTANGECSNKQECKTYSFWEGLDKVINKYIDSKTLEDLIK